MKKMILASLLTMVCFTANAQKESSWFFRAGVGTQATDECFKGLAFSTEIGKSFNGFEVSGSMDYYHRAPGNDDIYDVNYSSFNDNNTLTSNLPDKEIWSGFMIRANVGYDVLRLVSKATRHHIRPFVGIGYAIKTDVAGYHSSDGRESTDLHYQGDNGIDFALGVRYEYSISKSLDLGAFYELKLNIIEKDLMGINLRKSF